MITQLNPLPDGILNLNATQLPTVVNNHTLVHLEGRIKQPVFISILQHGDEHTGWDAIQAYLSKHLDNLPRSMIILFGNIEAAKHNVRQLDHQPDFNRSWPSHLILDTPESRTMREITEIIRQHQPFASVDIHNNSGRNPHYSGINALQPAFVNLAGLFADTMIYFTNPYGIQSGAFVDICPAVTVECGMSGESDGNKQTLQFLESLMTHENSNQQHGNTPQVYKIFATVKINQNFDYGFEQQGREFMLVPNLDHLNFTAIGPGQVFGQLDETLTKKQIMPLMVTDQNNQDITAEYFAIKGNQVVCTQHCVPAMITQKIQAIKHDCLCYIMQPIDVSTIEIVEPAQHQSANT